MKLKNIISELESLESFSDPKDYLEQYQTPPSVAGEMIHYISNNYSLKDYTIADLGCGTGILGISAALCGCENVFLFDIDEDALNIAKRNVQNLELEDKIHIIQCDVNQLTGWKKLNKYYDLVITNPPFGIRSENGADVEFLKTASYICNNTIFSLHKFSALFILFLNEVILSPPINKNNILTTNITAGRNTLIINNSFFLNGLFLR